MACDKLLPSKLGRIDLVLSFRVLDSFFCGKYSQVMSGVLASWVVPT